MFGQQILLSNFKNKTKSKHSSHTHIDYDLFYETYRDVVIKRLTALRIHTRIYEKESRRLFLNGKIIFTLSASADLYIFNEIISIAKIQGYKKSLTYTFFTKAAPLLKNQWQKNAPTHTFFTKIVSLLKFLLVSERISNDILDNMK